MSENKTFINESQRIVACILDIGESLLTSGAEVMRVEDTITRLCSAYGFVSSDVLTILSSIILTATDQNGDIITFFVMEPESDEAIQPGALTYMQVVTTTTADGIDQDSIVENEDGSFSLPSTVTVLANAEQAKLLASYEGSASIHAAFVYRGDKKTTDKFLAAQDAFFSKEDEVILLEGSEANV